MSARLRYSNHALIRLSERGIRRAWVAAAIAAVKPTVHGHQAAFVLSAGELRARFGQAVRGGLRVLVDLRRAVVITVHWLLGSEE